MEDEVANTEEPWTQVRSKRNRRSRRIPSNTEGSIPTSSSSTASPKESTRVGTLLTVAEIRADHQKFLLQWRDSSCCRTLKEFIKFRKDPSISSAICLGNGSFDPETGSFSSKRSAHLQLAAFMTVVEGLQQRSQQPIRTVFQEPVFTSADKEFLMSLGHEVVETPVGFSLVAHDSLLFGIHLYLPHLVAAVGKHVPAIIIGSDYHLWENSPDPDTEKIEKIKSLDKLFDKAPFPEDPDLFPTFSDTTIHWRRASSTSPI